MLNCYIVDDSPSCIRLLTKYINETKGLQLSGTTDSGQEALLYLQRSDTGVDIVFLDINIGDLSGLDILDKISHFYSVVLVSGHRHYAQEAFVKGASGYLYKPLEYDRFFAAIQKIKETPARRPERPEPPPAHIFVPAEGREVRVRIETADIEYIQSAKNFSSIFLSDGTAIFCSLSLKQIEGVLAAPHFLRVNRSTIVNVDKIIRYDAYDVFLKGKKEFSFGENYRTACMQILKSNSASF
ncbi:MAG: hypothetical protein BGO31_12925 [Bacteroidetes bacterium 43-16]|nr:MAG: hypothetical protein BGO31_12925 [Bacteroidetes bacterium 43-16]